MTPSARAFKPIEMRAEDQVNFSPIENPSAVVALADSPIHLTRAVRISKPSGACRPPPHEPLENGSIRSLCSLRPKCLSPSLMSPFPPQWLIHADVTGRPNNIMKVGSITFPSGSQNGGAVAFYTQPGSLVLHPIDKGVLPFFPFFFFFFFYSIQPLRLPLRDTSGMHPPLFNTILRMRNTTPFPGK